MLKLYSHPHPILGKNAFIDPYGASWSEPLPERKDFWEAKNFCSQLKISPTSTCSLPSSKDYNTLLNNAALDQLPYFQGKWFWSDGAIEGEPDFGWVMNGSNGHIGTAYNIRPHFFQCRCVDSAIESLYRKGSMMRALSLPIEKKVMSKTDGGSYERVSHWRFNATSFLDPNGFLWLIPEILRSKSNIEITQYCSNLKIGQEITCRLPKTEEVSLMTQTSYQRVLRFILLDDSENSPEKISTKYWSPSYLRAQMMTDGGTFNGACVCHPH